MELHFGQIVLPYIGKPERKQGKFKSRQERQPPTSIQVAERLEEKYHLKEVFFNAHKKKIAFFYQQALLDALNDAIHGGYVPNDLNVLFMKANHSTAQSFRDAINKRWFDNRINGVPTGRSLRGESSRFKGGFTRKKINGKFVIVSRPSFYDTQLYSKSSVNWVE